jgi:S-adenosylmethionine decarboxylase
VNTHLTIPTSYESMTLSRVLKFDEKKTPLGKHIIAEFNGASRLDDADFLEQALLSACKAAGATVLSCNMHSFTDPKGGGGVTGIVLLSESHLSIHTWPEFSYCAIDAFTCGECDPEVAIEKLHQYLQPTSVEAVCIDRGVGVSARDRSVL